MDSGKRREGNLILAFFHNMLTVRKRIFMKGDIMAATTTSRKRKGRGNIQKKANGNACVLPDMTRFTLLVLQKKKFKKNSINSI